MASRGASAALSRRRPLRALGRNGAALLLALLVIPTALTAGMRATPRLDLVYESVEFHLVVVSSIAAAALVVSLLTAAVASRAPGPGAILLAVGCEFVGFLMLVHGLTTPGILGRPLNMWVARTPLLAMAGFALCLAAATGNREGRLPRLVARYPRAVLGLATLVLAAASTAIVLNPEMWSGAAPIPGEAIGAHVLAGLTGGVLLLVGGVHWRRWRMGRDRIELALVLACWLGVDATVSFEVGQLWRISWWDYHAYLLAGFAAAAWAVIVGYRRTRSVKGALSSVSVTDPLEHLARGYPEALHALTGAVEAKDTYTRGHSERVADLSSRIGLHLDLDPDTLRGLSQGALLHDIGKIGVPDQVLNKPGELTRDEWEWITAHPVVGWEMASRAPSLRDSLAVVRHHHERWDGSGYPDGLASKEIPLAARIAAVADVWDALTSDRAYRTAWPAEEALAYVVAGRETLFDPRCVEAFVDLLAHRGVSSLSTAVDPEALAAAAEACHAGRSRTRVDSRRAG